MTIPPWESELCSVARFYNLDPAAVGNWAAPEFLDRQEYMFYQIHLDQQEIKRAERASKNGR